MRYILPLLSIFALSLGGCAASIPPVSATRFHGQEPINPAPTKVSAESSLEGLNYSNAVSQELVRLGFSDAPAGAAPIYTAKVSFSRTTRTKTKRSPVSVGVGGGTGGGGFGIGLGTSIGLGGGPREIIITQMSVQLIRISDAKPVWEGRAETEAPASAPASQPGLAAGKLARALFSAFPGESGKTITVP
jgi:hypothetical protein